MHSLLVLLLLTNNNAELLKEKSVIVPKRCSLSLARGFSFSFSLSLPHSYYYSTDKHAFSNLLERQSASCTSSFIEAPNLLWPVNQPMGKGMFSSRMTLTSECFVLLINTTKRKRQNERTNKEVLFSSFGRSMQRITRYLRESIEDIDSFYSLLKINIDYLTFTSSNLLQSKSEMRILKN